MAVSVKTVVAAATDSDATIAAALNSGVTYTTIHGVACMPLSNTQWKIIMVYE